MNTTLIRNDGLGAQLANPTVELNSNQRLRSTGN